MIFERSGPFCFFKFREIKTSTFCLHFLGESRRPYGDNNDTTTTTTPYTLVRKGSDKVKAVKNIRTYKKQDPGKSSDMILQSSVKPGKKDEWTLDASPLIGQL